MAIFGKDRTQQGARNGSTIVAAGTEFVGNLTLKDTLHVDGRIEGEVKSESSVVIGADGYLKGQIKATSIVVSGRLDGSISAERLEIVAGGCVEGDVHIVDLVIEPGGRFNGSSEILTSEAPHKQIAAGGAASEITKKSSEKTKTPNNKSSESSNDGIGSASTA